MDPATVAFIVGIASIFLVAPIVQGWAVTVLWGWFVAPVFGLPQLTIPVAIGLALTAMLITRPDYSAAVERSKTMNPGEIIGEAIGGLLFGPGFVVGFGWILHHYFM